MAKIEKFEEILSWQEARKMNASIGKLIDEGRFKSSYRLINQIEGSAGSVMDNIAEGFERGGNKELIQYLYIAKASCGEFRSQLYRALDRAFLTEHKFAGFEAQAKQISGLIQKFIHYLENTNNRGVKYRNKGAA